MNLSREDVESVLLKAVNNVDASSPGVQRAKSLFIQNCLPALTDKVYSNLPSLFTSDKTLAEQASAAITNAIDTAYSNLFSEVEGVVSSLTDEAEGKIVAALRPERNGSLISHSKARSTSPAPRHLRRRPENATSCTRASLVGTGRQTPSSAHSHRLQCPLEA